jgi:hypothetical protein
LLDLHVYKILIHLAIVTCIVQCREFEETKDLIRSRKSKKDRQYNDQKKKRQKDKQWFAKHYKENKAQTLNKTKAEGGGDPMCSGRYPVPVQLVSQ